MPKTPARFSPRGKTLASGAEAKLRFLASGVDPFLGIHSRARVGSGRRRDSVAQS